MNRKNRRKLAADAGGAPSPRKKAETAGVLAFKEAFKDLMKETPVARLGTEARLSNEDPRVKGGLAQRSLVSMVGGSSGGIGGAGVQPQRRKREGRPGRRR